MKKWKRRRESGKYFGGFHSSIASLFRRYCVLQSKNNKYKTMKQSNREII